MKRKLWVIAMGLIATVASAGAQELPGSGEGGNCQPDGAHIVASLCEQNCCAGFCGSCHVDGHYICGHGHDQ